MMPVYFNIESHLWILYLFFVNGFLLHAGSRQLSKNYHQLTASLEASVLAAFFLSLALNGLVLLVLDLIGKSFSLMLPILLTLTVINVGFLIYRKGLLAAINALKVDYGVARLILYIIVFIILFYNGGLIEQTADSWWHMSFANQIATENSFSPEYGHLNGVSSRYYPPLWHGNLALATTVSGISLAELWNSFTAWGAVLKVMGFYLLAWSLSKDVTISILSAALFVLLPGVGDSYLRVSAWPSHIAYAALFSLFYATFFYLDNYSREAEGVLKSVFRYIISQHAISLTIIVLLAIITFTHQLELIWFYAGLLMYAVTCIANDLTRSSQVSSDLQNDFFRVIVWLVLLIVIAAGTYFIITKWRTFNSDWDLLVAYCLPMVFFLLISCAFWGFRKKESNNSSLITKPLILGTLILLVFSIDARHLLSLVSPELAYPNQRYHELPLIAEGLFGGKLRVPGWHLQLRNGLLYSGLVSIVLSWVLVLIKPSRLTLFLAGNATLAFLCCASPYVYQWLQYVMNYHSPWRIAILIFHPIILATTLTFAWRYLMPAPIK